MYKAKSLNLWSDGSSHYIAYHIRKKMLKECLERYGDYARKTKRNTMGNL